MRGASTARGSCSTSAHRMGSRCSTTQPDRKSTRLNSSHSQISYAVFCLKKKKLVELGFLDHQRSRVDRRSVRIRLTAQGQEIRKIVDALYQKHVKTVEQVVGISNEEFATLNKSLHRLERFWTDQILYRL